jgi:hypothetical protein
VPGGPVPDSGLSTAGTASLLQTPLRRPQRSPRDSPLVLLSASCQLVPFSSLDRFLEIFEIYFNNINFVNYTLTNLYSHFCIFIQPGISAHTHMHTIVYTHTYSHGRALIPPCVTSPRFPAPDDFRLCLQYSLFFLNLHKKMSP